MITVRLCLRCNNPNLYVTRFIYLTISSTFNLLELTMSDFDQELDARGLNCPLPILRAKKAINGLESGQVLRIIATDPGSVKDFEAFAKQTGNELMESTENDGEYAFRLRKG